MTVPPETRSNLNAQPIREFRDAVQSGLFAGGILDIFIGKDRYRLNPVNFEMKEGNVTCSAPTVTKWLGQDGWQPQAFFSIGLMVNARATVVLLHGDEHELILVISSHMTTAGRAQFVLYPRTPDGSEPTVQITEWGTGTIPPE